MPATAGTTRRLLFIVNPVAGAGKAGKCWPALERELQRDGVTGEVVFTAGPGDALRLAQEAARSHDTLVAAGGDGTVFEIASGILASPEPRPALGILPLGTGNDTAEALHLAGEGNCRHALRKVEPRDIDVIEIRCSADGKPIVRHALLFAAVGIVSDVLERTTPTVKRLFGQRLAYPVGVIRALAGYNSPRMRLKFDGQSREDRFLFVCASNSERAGGGMRFAPGARMDDGLLNLNLIESAGRLEALRHLRSLCQGLHVTHPKVRYLPARTLYVEAEPPIPVTADGDLLGLTPAHFEVRPGALRVLVAGN